MGCGSANLRSRDSGWIVVGESASIVVAPRVDPMSKTELVPVLVHPELAEGVREMMREVEAFRTAADEPGEVDFAAAERSLAAIVAKLECAGLARMLRSLDPREERVEVDGFAWRRLNLQAGETYWSLRGPVRVERGLYRREDVRNGPTMVPLDKRAGMVEGRYTPAAAKAVAKLAEALPSRDADALVRSLGVLPYSRASQQRAGLDIGARWDGLHEAAAPAITETMTLPKAAATLSIAADRVALPMAEDRTPTPEDIAAGVKNPFSVNYRMAFVGVLTLCDADGEGLTSIRHAHIADDGEKTVRASLAADVARLLKRRPDLKLVTLSDGAPDMQALVDGAAEGLPVAAKLTDIWHLLEKLAAAVRSTGRYPKDQIADWKAALLAHDDTIENIEAELKGWGAEFEAETIPEELHAALTYIANRRDRLRYAAAHAAGLPIGSGTAEATCKTIVTVRMRRAGASWTPEGAQAILGLRAVGTSSPERWDDAMDRLIASYKAHVKPLPPRVGRTK